MYPAETRWLKNSFEGMHNVYLAVLRVRNDA
jgi:hypothetical protein